MVEAWNQPAADLSHPKPGRGQRLVDCRHELDFTNAGPKSIGSCCESAHDIYHNHNAGRRAGAIST
jgi:hypothetical protein